MTSYDNRPPSSASQITVGVGELRSDTVGLIRRVAAGVTVLVMRRGRVIARFESVQPDRDSPTTPMVDVVSVTELRGRAGWWVDRAARGRILKIVQHGELVAHLRNHEMVAATARPRRVR
jgi:antitoxin (DNA-binding transcriptional repressor) of toxin-antitoxin stability system